MNQKSSRVGGSTPASRATSCLYNARVVRHNTAMPFVSAILLQRHAVRHDTTSRGMARHGTERHGVARRHTAWRAVVPRRTARRRAAPRGAYRTGRHRAAWHGTIQCRTAPHDTIVLSCGNYEISPLIGRVTQFTIVCTHRRMNSSNATGGNHNRPPRRPPLGFAKR